jgi:hypothetical protein
VAAKLMEEMYETGFSYLNGIIRQINPKLSAREVKDADHYHRGVIEGGRFPGIPPALGEICSVRNHRSSAASGQTNGDAPAMNRSARPAMQP